MSKQEKIKIGGIDAYNRKYCLFHCVGKLHKAIYWNNRPCHRCCVCGDLLRKPTDKDLTVALPVERCGVLFKC